MRRASTEDFIKKAREKHSDSYDYSFVEYINSKNKVRMVRGVRQR